MDTLTVTIERFIDDHQPGIVECVLVDADGCVHRFVEKVPVVSLAGLGPGSAYPQPGSIGCVVEAAWIDRQGRQCVRVSTERPWDIASSAGETRFTVFREQLVQAPDQAGPAIGNDGV